MHGGPYEIAVPNDGWDFDGSQHNERLLRPFCVEVENHFPPKKLRLYRYIANSEDNYLVNRLGNHFRGFFTLSTARHELPQYLENCFYRPLEELSEEYGDEDLFSFDALIYVRSTACLDVTGFVTTYAHEFQHLVQHSDTPKLAHVNGILYNSVGQLDPTVKAFDIPNEREANIVSKRVAESIVGAAAVRDFAEEQITFMSSLGEGDQVARWQFFRDVSSSTPYNLLQETIPWIDKFKDRIDFGVDFNVPDWWLGTDTDAEEAQE